MFGILIRRLSLIKKSKVKEFDRCLIIWNIDNTNLEKNNLAITKIIEMDGKYYCQTKFIDVIDRVRIPFDFEMVTESVLSTRISSSLITNMILYPFGKNVRRLICVESNFLLTQNITKYLLSTNLLFTFNNFSFYCIIKFLFNPSLFKNMYW